MGVHHQGSGATHKQIPRSLPGSVGKGIRQRPPLNKDAEIQTYHSGVTSILSHSLFCCLECPTDTSNHHVQTELVIFPHILWFSLWTCLRDEYLVITLTLAHILSFLPLKCMSAVPAPLSLYPILLCKSASSLMWTTS